MTNSFLGIPIDGTIVRGEHSVTQFPLEDFTPVIKAVLDDENVSSFGWRQYTPYFNDGEPCVFGAGEIWACPAGHSRDEDSDPWDSRFHLWGEVWGADGGQEESRPEWWRATRDRLIALDRAVQGGHFDNVLLDAFGDHAEITVARGGITVESFSHD